jgi:hypothetical protein
VASNLSPSCSRSAVNNDGPAGSLAVDCEFAGAESAARGALAGSNRSLTSK